MHVSGIRLENVRVFEGEHVLPVDRGLTVLIGRNNAGKSTALRAPFAITQRSQDRPPLAAFSRGGAGECTVGLRLALSTNEFHRLLGFDAAMVMDIEVGRPLGPVATLGTHWQWEGWWQDPAVEVGVRWGSGGTPLPRFRLLSRAVDTFVEASSSKGHPSVVMGGVAASTNSGQGWFARGLQLAPPDERTGGVGPLIAYWEHHCIESSTGWIVRSGRRLRDTDEGKLQEVLTFLRMKHPREFEHVSRAVQRALPEFTGLDFLDVQGTGFSYRPGFVRVGASGAPLARESIGSGAWAYLCIFTAARAAKATGARVLFLDEPHLYMHPGLERLLLEELLEPEYWDEQPLQIVAATHSPTFVTVAVEGGTLNVLDWVDEARTSVSVRTVSSGDSTGNLFAGLTSDPGDLLYADRLVFVEGPSDVAALRILARERCKLKAHLRFVPLRETDAIGSEVARYFSVIVQAGGAGTRSRAILLLDGDKRATLEPAWERLGVLDPRKTAGLELVWSDSRGNDLESVFCEEAFLVAYFKELGIDEASSQPQVAIAIAALSFPATKKAQKGCTAIRALHEKLLGDADTGLTKAADLDKLVRFYVNSVGSPHAKAVEERLAGIEAALRKLGE